MKMKSINKKKRIIIFKVWFIFFIITKIIIYTKVSFVAKFISAAFITLFPYLFYLIFIALLIHLLFKLIIIHLLEQLSHLLKSTLTILLVLGIFFVNILHQFLPTFNIVLEILASERSQLYKLWLNKLGLELLAIIPL